MSRVLTLTLILYLPLALAAALEFASGISPDRIGSPTFITIFLAWVANGSVCFVAALAVAGRALKGLYSGREAWLRGLQSATGIILGVLPFLIFDELARKLWMFVSN